MYRIIHYVMGFLWLELTGDNVLEAITVISAEGINTGNFKPSDKGYYITCSVFGADKLIKRLKELGVNVTVIDKKGLPFSIGKHLRRPGLWVGFALALLIIFGSTRLLWDVRAECDGDYDRAELFQQLKILGVYPGASLYGINVYEAEQRFLIENTRFSDIAINIQGTVATVKLRLRTNAIHKQEDTTPCNIVASEAGVIEKITSTKGKPALKKGDTVAAGDVLINGEVIGVHGEVYLQHATGTVTARVYREYTVMIPLKTTQKQYTGKVETKVLYNLLGREIPLYKDETSPFAYSDAETTTQEQSVLGLKLPIKKETVTYKEYTLCPIEITESEAKAKALAAFQGYLERETEGEVINTYTEYYYSEEFNGIMLSATAEIIMEIGTERPLTPQVP